MNLAVHNHSAIENIDAQLILITKAVRGLLKNAGKEQKDIDAVAPEFKDHHNVTETKIDTEEKK